MSTEVEGLTPLFHLSQKEVVAKSKPMPNAKAPTKILDT